MKKKITVEYVDGVKVTRIFISDKEKMERAAKLLSKIIKQHKAP